MTLAPAETVARGVALVIPTLCGGGAERAMIRMAGWWVARGAKVTLITFDAGPSAYPLHPAVQRIALNEISLPHGLPAETAWPAEAANIVRLRLALQLCLAECAQRPLPVLSFLSRMNLRTLLAARNLPCRVVVVERTYPPLCPLPEREERLRRELYPLAHSIVFQTRRALDDWGGRFLAADKCAVIPNSAPAFQHCATEPASAYPQHGSEAQPFFLAAGRLTPEKGFELLLDAFAPIAREFPGARLLIAGEGLLRPRLEDQIIRLGLEKRVELPGFISRLPELMGRALAFVLSSEFEGFPNVLLESLARGCPAIAFDCPAGPREIIRHGLDGLLVESGNVAALFQAMRRLLEEPALREKLSEAAPEVCGRFAEEKIMRQWTAVLCGHGASDARGASHA